MLAGSDLHTVKILHDKNFFRIIPAKKFAQYILSSVMSLNQWGASFSRCLGDKVVFTTLHEMQTRSSNENSVCLSVHLSVCLSVRLSVTRVIPDKMEERSVQIFIPYERTFILVFWEEEWLVGGWSLLRKILGQLTPVGTKSPIFNQ